MDILTNIYNNLQIYYNNNHIHLNDSFEPMQIGKNKLSQDVTDELINKIKVHVGMSKILNKIDGYEKSNIVIDDDDLHLLDNIANVPNFLHLYTHDPKKNKSSFNIKLNHEYDNEDYVRYIFNEIVYYVDEYLMKNIIKIYEDNLKVCEINDFLYNTETIKMFDKTIKSDIRYLSAYLYKINQYEDKKYIFICNNNTYEKYKSTFKDHFFCKNGHCDDNIIYYINTETIILNLRMIAISNIDLSSSIKVIMSTPDSKSIFKYTNRFEIV